LESDAVTNLGLQGWMKCLDPECRGRHENGWHRHQYDYVVDPAAPKLAGYAAPAEWRVAVEDFVEATLKSRYPSARVSAVRYRRDGRVLTVVFQPYDGKPHPCTQADHRHEHWHDVLLEVELDSNGAHVGRWRCGKNGSRPYDMCDAAALAVTPPPAPVPAVPVGGSARAAYTAPPPPKPAAAPVRMAHPCTTHPAPASGQAAVYTPPTPPVARRGRCSDADGRREVDGTAPTAVGAGGGVKGASDRRDESSGCGDGMSHRKRHKTLQSAITSFLSNKGRP